MPSGPAERPAPRASRPVRQPVSVRLCDALCVCAAVWTLCCHAVVAAGGSFRDLLGVAAPAGGAALAALVALRVRARARERRAPPGPPTAPPPALSPPLPPDGFGRRLRGAAALSGLVAIAVAFRLGSVIGIWWACVATLGFAFAVALRRTPQPRPQPPAAAGRGRELALWGLALLCAWISLRYRRVVFDMPFYLSIANAAVDRPDAQLMVDTIHGVAGLALHMPAHRVHSYELFVAALSYAIGWQVIIIYQLVVGTVSAVFVPLALARLFRILTPAHWLASVAVVLAVLIGGGGTLSWYGNLSLVRIFHGKCVYMSVLLPLVFAYGLRFGAQPSAARWWRLAAAQVASLGLTSSALWSAPIAAGLAVVCAVRWDRRTPRVLALAGLSSAYLVGVGALLASQLSGVAAAVVERPAGASLQDALARVFGDGRLLFVSFAGIAIAWSVRRGGLAQRFAIGVPLATLLLVLDPYTSEFVSRTMTGPSYWRATWVLPVPILLALLLTGPLAWPQRAGARRLGALATAAAVAAFVLLVPTRSSLDPPNAHSVGIGAITVPPFYVVAQKLNRYAGPDEMVVAPQKVAAWVIAHHHHPYVAYARDVWLRRLDRELGHGRAQLRMLMAEILSAPYDSEVRTRKTPEFAQRAALPGRFRSFRRGLEELRVAAVCLNEQAPDVGRVRRVLRRSGFERRDAVYTYEIWSREPLPQPVATPANPDAQPG